MSAAKRRIKRKIAMLARMDTTHWLCHMIWRATGRRSVWRARAWMTPSERSNKGARIHANMKALGAKLARQGHIDKAMEAINVARAKQRRPRMGA